MDKQTPRVVSGAATPKKRRPLLRWIFIGMGLLLVACCGLVVIIGVFAPDDRGGEDVVVVDEEPVEVADAGPQAVPDATLPPTDTPAPTDMPAPTDTPAPTSTLAPTDTPPPPTATPRPTATLEPLPALEARLAGTIGRSNRDVNPRLELLDQDGTVEVMWAINDNLTRNLLRNGVMLDITKMLEVFADEVYPYSTVVFRGTFPLVDQFGNSREETVVVATYSRDTVQRINFANFLFDNVYNIADDLFLHRAMQD